MKTAPPKSKQSLAAISLMAAMADGSIKDAERALVNEAFSGLSEEERGKVYERVLRKQTSISSELAHLDKKEQWEAALSLARQICESDAGVNEKERIFLSRMEAMFATSLAEQKSEEIPEWALDFSARAAAIRLADHPMATLWLSTLKIQMARTLRHHANRENKWEGRNEIGTVTRLLLLPDRTLLQQLRKSGLEVRPESAEFAFASTAALARLFERFYLHGEKLKAGQIRVAFRTRYARALAEYAHHSARIEAWLRQGDLFSFAIRAI